VRCDPRDWESVAAGRCGGLQLGGIVRWLVGDNVGRVVGDNVRQFHGELVGVRIRSFVGLVFFGRELVVRYFVRQLVGNVVGLVLVE
jgi:hypothetical protein